MARPVKVLFLCIGNSCRSQMAEALARHLASDVIDASSAGIAPLGLIAPSTKAALAEIGVSVDGQYSKGIHDADADGAQWIVNMSGEPVENFFAGSKAPIENWDIADPYGSDLELYRQIRDEIEARVKELAARLRTACQPASKNRPGRSAGKT